MRDAEVAEARHASVVEEDVRGLDVAMDDAEAVGLAERGEHGLCDLDRTRRGERLPHDHLLECPASHPRKDERRPFGHVVA